MPINRISHDLHDCDFASKIKRNLTATSNQVPKYDINVEKRNSCVYVANCSLPEVMYNDQFITVICLINLFIIHFPGMYV